jgi:polyisoprenoid-binding protein YceI
MAWEIDLAHSHVSFVATHMMISKVRGEFTVLGGNVEYDEETPAETSVDVYVSAASINTRNTDRDAHLQSEDFLAAAEYPEIRFSSTSVDVIDDNHAKLHGELTIRDVTKPITLDVEYIGKAKDPFQGRTSVGFRGEGTINRKEWGLTWNQALETGGVLVGEQIDINIDLELVKVEEDEAEEASA